jgi:hypothetical protein
MVPYKHRMVGFKVLLSFYATCGESVQPLQSVKLIDYLCSQSTAAWTLTWLNHGTLMINCCFIIYLWCLYLINWVGMNLHSLVTRLLIKLDSLKCWTAWTLAIHLMALHVMLFSLAEYVLCSCLFTFLYLQHPDCCSDWENFEDIPGDF